MTGTQNDIHARAEAVTLAVNAVAWDELSCLQERAIENFIARALMQERDRCLGILVAERKAIEAEERWDYAETAIIECLKLLEQDISSGMVAS